MDLQTAIAVILTLANFLDGKKGVALNNEWKAKLAKAKQVLLNAGVYAKTIDGMYLTIKQVGGLYMTDWVAIREEKSGGLDDLDKVFQKMITQSAEANQTDQSALSLDV